MKIKNVCLVLFIFTLSISFVSLGNITEISEQKNQDLSNIQPILSDIYVENYTVPGVTSSVPLNQILKIGILGDLNDITGNHSWKGAMLAAREINKIGGILLNGTPYYIGIAAEDTGEAEFPIDYAKAVNAADRMTYVNEPHFVIGGYRYESLEAYLHVFMDEHIPFICIGCPVEELSDNVINWYPYYKYFFRVMPINTTALGLELVSYISDLANYLSITFEGNITIVEILREGLTWTTHLYHLLDALLSTYNLTVSETSIPVTLPPTVIGSILDSLGASGTQIVIPLLSGQFGSHLGHYYGLLKPRFLLAGLNLRAQSDIYWDDTTGGSQYEIVMQSVHNTSKTPLTMPFWNNFYEEYGEEPYYTAAGSYDAVRLLTNATVETQSFNSDSIVSNLEGKDISNPFIGASCKIAFSNSHDIIEGWPYGTSLFCQWQMDGNKVVVPSWDNIYPDSIATGTVSIPYWGINDLVEDNTHKLPGNFTLTSDADPIDIDGAFNLSWTPSDGVDRYSIYYSEDSINYISKRYTTVVGRNAVSPYALTNFENGDYYFVVVAYNGTGQKFSNIVLVSVQKPSNGGNGGNGEFPIIPVVVGTSAGGVIAVVVIYLFLKRRKT